jgi:hypothetical protein
VETFVTCLAREFKANLFDQLPLLYALIANPLREISTGSCKSNNTNNAPIIHDLSKMGVSEESLLVALRLYLLLLPALTRPAPFQSFLDEMVPLLIDVLSCRFERARELASDCIAASCALGNTKVCLGLELSFVCFSLASNYLLCLLCCLFPSVIFYYFF